MRFSFASARCKCYFGVLRALNSVTGLKTINDLKAKLTVDSKENYSLVLFNIDNFFAINNAYGFEVGDEVIKQTSSILSNTLKCCASLYHVMGDEFGALIFSECDPYEIAQSVLAVFNNEPINVVNTELRLTVSAGIATGKGMDLLKQATLALIEARLHGKGRINIYTPNCEIERQIEHNFKWQNRLKNAFENNNFMPYFQPIVDLNSGKIEKYECLIRMSDTEGVVEQPLEFLGAAKNSGLLSYITRTVMAQSFNVFKNNNYAFSVNITEDDLQDELFLSFVKHKLSHCNIDPSRVYFEILEGIGTNIVSDSLNTLRELKKLGCKLVVDDFGVGHSNFSRMLELEIDVIKIDGSFIKNITESETSQKIVKTIVGFAKAINATVTAEYVSSQEIYNFVKELNVDHAQGFFIGAPKPYLIEG